MCKRSGTDVQLTEYPGAQHVFDWKALKEPMKLAQAQTIRNCRLAEAANGGIFNTKTNQPFTYRAPCVELGPTIAYNQEASTQVRTAMKELVTATGAKPP